MSTWGDGDHTQTVLVFPRNDVVGGQERKKKKLSDAKRFAAENADSSLNLETL